MGCKQTKIVRSISNNPAAQERLERSEVIDEVTSKNEAETSPKTTNVIRADSEVTTDLLQVVELQETGISSISDEDITISVHKALKESLPAYYIDSEKAETLSPCLRRTYIMRMNNSDNTIYPDQAGTSLNHSIQPTTDKLHVCFYIKNLGFVKFLYQRRSGTDLILASPFHDNNTKAGSAVQVSISKALKEKTPIEGIVAALDEIHSTSKEKFKGKDFLWKMSGRQDNFAINIPNIPGKKSLWMCPETASRDGQNDHIRMTDSKSKMFHLELNQV